MLKLLKGTMSLFEFNDDYPQKKGNREIVPDKPIEQSETIMEYFNCFGKGNHDTKKNNSLNPQLM